MTPNVCRQSRGFTLTELLIAVVILAIGLLGVAGMQTHSVQATGSALNHSQATNLAQDIAERMRANREAARNGDYDGTYNSVPSSGSNCTTGTCGPTALAGYEIEQWMELITELPEGTGEIAVSETAEGVTMADITITWTSRIWDPTGELDQDGDGVETRDISLTTSI